jgi:MFS family permease
MDESGNADEQAPEMQSGPDKAMPDAVTGAGHDEPARAVDRTTYWQLTKVPSLVPLVTAATLGVFAERVTAVTVVLIVLERYHSTQLAGLAMLLLTLPGLVFSPIAGAILDRRGRSRLIALDYLVATGGMGVVSLSMIGQPSPVLVLVIASLMSLSAPLSRAGVRALFPTMAPRVLWDRINAIDSARYMVATIGGPAVAGILIDQVGATFALVVTAVLYALAAAFAISVHDSGGSPASAGLLSQSRSGLLYVWRNASLRGLALSLLPYNLGLGALMIALPAVVLQQLHWSAGGLGLLWTLSGAASIGTALLVARLGSNDRERRLMLMGAMTWMSGALVLAIAPSPAPIVLAMVAIGVGIGLLDLGVFALRQRRTEGSSMGRAFAVSISLNMVGIPIGSGLAGTLLTHWVSGTLLVIALSAAATALLIVATVPRWHSHPS